MAAGNSQSPQGPKATVEAMILGQRMLLKADDDPRQLERLVAFVNRKLDEVSVAGPVSTTKLAILAALNIAEDYFRALEENRQFRRQVAQKSRAILAELDP